MAAGPGEANHDCHILSTLFLDAKTFKIKRRNRGRLVASIFPSTSNHSPDEHIFKLYIKLFTLSIRCVAAKTVIWLQMEHVYDPRV